MAAKPTEKGKWVPPVPLVTSTGEVELNVAETLAINAWLDHHNRRVPYGSKAGEQMTNEIVARVLGKLLGHAAGLISPRKVETS